jgi:hypothetical protein
MRLIVSGEFQCSIVGSNTGNHPTAPSVTLNVDLFGVFENTLDFLRYSFEFVVRDSMAPYSERTELFSGTKKQTSGCIWKKPEVNFRWCSLNVKFRQYKFR